MSISFYALEANNSRPINFDENKPNLNVGNAFAVLKTMGLVRVDEGLWDFVEVPIADFRRACIKGMNATKRAMQNERAAYEDDRCFIRGIDSEGIKQRILWLMDWSADMAERGAVTIYWG